ncbi:MAG: prepilin-type N-terminal cleavage/methylation domain-containing protein [Planctomycetes bacterium]|nr:prepilin-type N-terminal cleavage/methylation domain-containing protein [Planctomycetota bacterium]
MHREPRHPSTLRAPRPTGRAASGPSAAGFTLIELLAVIGIISVLMGIGLGYLGRTDPEMVAQTILRGERRAAQMTARAEGVPTEVWVRPGLENEPATVQSRLLEPVVSFQFEPGQPFLDQRLRPALAGEEVAAGRFGAARRPHPEDKLPLLRWPVPPLLADLRDGFVLRIDLYLEQRRDCVVVDMPPMLEVRLDDDLRPDARLRLVDGNGETQRVSVQGQLSMPLRRWTTLEVGYDGRAFWLQVDDREFGRVTAEGQPQQKQEMTLDLSPVEAAVPGIVDELRLLAFAFAPPQYLPIELQPTRTFRFTYDKRGEPVDQPVLVYEDLDGGEPGR